MCVLVAAWVARSELLRHSLRARHLGYFFLGAAPLIAAGGALAHAVDVGGAKVLSYWIYAPAAYPGASFLGGALVCWIALALYARIVFGHTLQAMDFLDAIAPSILLMYGLGRIGCHLAGHSTCCGRPSEAWYAVLYPYTVGVDVRVVPMALVEATLGLGLFSWLWLRRRRMSPGGSVFAWHWILLGSERLCVEPWRLNPRHAFGLTQAQWLSMALIASGIVLLWNLRGQRSILKKTGALDRWSDT
jgi:prolipoprotein diacylglyceryltransferase